VPVRGTHPVSYKWRKNGSDLDGETSAALLIHAFDENDVGTYQVTVTNDIGETITDTFDLNLSGDTFINWKFLHPLPSDVKYHQVEYLNGRYFAVGSNKFGNRQGTIASSLDGINWFVVHSLPEHSIHAIAYGEGIYVVVGYDGIILTSMNGFDWSEAASGVSFDFTDVTYGEGKFVAVADGMAAVADAQLMDWSIHEVGGNISNVIYGNGYFIAGKGDETYRSHDGVAWLMVDDRYNSRGFIFDGEYIYATLGYGSDEFDGLHKSSDGKNWELVRQNYSGEYHDHYNGLLYSAGSGITEYNPLTQSEIFNDLRDVFLIPSGSLIGEPVDLAISPSGECVAVGSNGVIIYSDNLTDFELVSHFFNADLMAVAYGNGRFVGVGDRNTIVESVDGVTWELGYQDLNKEAFIDIEYGNGTFVVIGSHYSLLTSPDGLSWTVHPPKLEILDKGGLDWIEHAGQWFWGKSDRDGLSYYSKDGIRWRASPVSVFHGIAYNQGTYVAIGLDGIVRYSLDGENWVESYDTNGSVWELVYGDGKFFASADSRYIYSTDGISWTEGEWGYDEDPGYAYEFEYAARNFLTTRNLHKSLDGIAWEQLPIYEVEDITASPRGVLILQKDNVIQYSSIHVSNSPDISVSLTTDLDVVEINNPVQITANVSHQAGDIDKVEFYLGQEMIGDDSGSPYTISWEPKCAGNNEFVAVAIDLSGNSTTSEPVTILAELPDDYVHEIPIVDLVVSQFKDIHFYDQDQELLVFTAILENQGIDDLLVGQEMDVMISLSQDAIWGNQDDQLLGVVNYSSGLGSSYSQELMQSYPMPDDLTVGDYRLGAYVDSGQVVPEVNEENNISFSEAIGYSPSYDVLIEQFGEGTVQKTFKSTIPNEAIVELKAVPAPGYFFRMWYWEDLVSVENPLELQLTKSTSLTAYFNPFDLTWRKLFFTNQEIDDGLSEAWMDADNDGVNNLQERMFGLNPKVPDKDKLPHIERRVDGPGEPYFVFTYRRYSDPFDILSRVEYSIDGELWMGTFPEDEEYIDNGDGTTTVNIRIADTLDSNKSVLFRYVIDDVPM
jgi:hypothetical protein